MMESYRFSGGVLEDFEGGGVEFGTIMTQKVLSVSVPCTFREREG